jgi:hypothetical protein
MQARSLHATAQRMGDPFPLPFDPALAEAHAAARAKRNPEEVIDEWAMPPPLDRTGETPEVMRARLVYQTRKRGTLENDLLFSTFAVQELPRMSFEEMKVFDKVRRCGCRSVGVSGNSGVGVLLYSCKSTKVQG